jgi:GxxExxY protein
LLETKIIGKGWDYIREQRIADTGNITDFIIQNKVIIELKSKPFLLKVDYYQLQRYLHSTQIKLGILVNFREQYLNPKRVLLANQ